MAEQQDINENLGKIYGKLEDLHVVSVRQQVILDEHVRRSTMLEEEIKPIKRHVAMVEGAIKLIGILAMVATIMEAIHLIFR